MMAREGVVFNEGRAALVRNRLRFRLKMEEVAAGEVGGRLRNGFTFLDGGRLIFSSWSASACWLFSSCELTMLAKSVSSSRLGCSLGDTDWGMRDMRGARVEEVVVGLGEVVMGVGTLDSVARSGLVRKRSEAWLRDGLRDESNVIGAMGVVVSSNAALSSSNPLSIDESGPGNPDTTAPSS